MLDGDAFVAAASLLPAPQLAAGIENCLLECTNSRLARPTEQPTFGGVKVNNGVAGLVQQVAAAGPALALFPPAAGLPSLHALLEATVLPPSATRGLMASPAVQLFVAHSMTGSGRRSGAELFDLGSAPSTYERGRSHIRAAARRGGTYFTLASGVPVWQQFELEAVAPGGGHNSSAGSAARGGAARGKQPRQKRMRPAAGADTEPSGAGSGAAAWPTAAGPCVLLQSACSCSHPDLGVLWCAHRCDAMHALLSDPALHVLDCDALAALLQPLTTRQLAQLLLTGERWDGGGATGRALGA